VRRGYHGVSTPPSMYSTAPVFQPPDPTATTEFKKFPAEGILGNYLSIWSSNCRHQIEKTKGFRCVASDVFFFV